MLWQEVFFLCFMNTRLAEFQPPGRLCLGAKIRWAGLFSPTALELQKSDMMNNTNEGRPSGTAKDQPQTLQEAPRPTFLRGLAGLRHMHDLEPDQRIVAARKELRDWRRQLSDCFRRGDFPATSVRQRVNACNQELEVLLKAPDRICRLSFL